MSTVHYQPLRLLAHGGMAELYLARELGVENFEKLVVVKRVLRVYARDRERAARLANETKILAHLTHPNIVHIMELAADETQLFIVMEYVDGVDLRQILRRFVEIGRRVPLGFACRVAADTLAGLGFAHRRRGLDGEPLGLVHRDVSPPNVMVSHEGGVKLLDFGIARSRLMGTRAQQLAGKIAYMSPEQVEMRPLDGRSDIFAVGAILWEMLEGRRIFPRNRIEQTMAAVRAGEVPPLSNKQVPRPLEALVRRALAHSPAWRPRDADEMREELETLMRGQRWPADGLTLRRTMRELFGAPRQEMLAPLEAAPTLIIEHGTPRTMPTPRPPPAASAGPRPIPEPTLVLKRQSAFSGRAGAFAIVALTLFGVSLVLVWILLLGRTVKF